MRRTDAGAARTRRAWRRRQDKFHDECGVFGIFGHPEAANLTYLGLYALQHRGQESAGIATADGEKMRISRAMGHVADAFDERALEALPGHLAIGHTRYSTAGESKLLNAQPILIDCAHGQIAIAHNGNLVNAQGAPRSPRQATGRFSRRTATPRWCCISTRDRASARWKTRWSSRSRR